MIEIGNHKIGLDNPCFIIAEAGVNHNGDLETALKLVEEAAKTGADCVKFQTFKAARVVTKDSPKAAYQLKVTPESESQLRMLEKLELTTEDYIKIVNHARKLDVTILSTPYSEEDADFLDELGFDAFKVASGQIVEPSFLRFLARKGKPIILSTGMADLSEVSDAVDVIRSEGNEQIVVLQCTTNYPSKIEEANINAMLTMKNAFKLIVGYSDHVPQNHATYAAVALGASVIEKHFTLDENMEGPDHSSSLNPQEFEDLVLGIRQIEASLGSGIKQPTTTENENAKGMRRSIVAKRPIKAGTVLTENDLCYKRPATGLKPSMADQLVGKTVKVDLNSDQQLNFDQIEW